MSQYRKKPVVIEAFQLGIDYMPDWFMDAVKAHEVVLHGSSSGFYHMADTNADIHAIEGWHHASYGDYIIRGVKGELYPCKPDIFDMTYDMVDQPMTHADRIRAMSDEELARWLEDIVPANCDCCINQMPCRFEHDTETVDYTEKYHCREGFLAWLQQPAEEGDND